MNLTRKTGTTVCRKILYMDPRCWRTMWQLRLAFKRDLGWMPSADYVMSELLVDPGLGSVMLKRCWDWYGKNKCPADQGPKGNRHRRSPDPNAFYEPGEEREDWGVKVKRKQKVETT